MTHHIEFQEAIFISFDLRGQEVHHKHKFPFLTDFNEGKNIFNKRCFRQIINWDKEKEETFKKIKAEKINKTFTMI